MNRCGPRANLLSGVFPRGHESVGRGVERERPGILGIPWLNHDAGDSVVRPVARPGQGLASQPRGLLEGTADCVITCVMKCRFQEPRPVTEGGAGRSLTGDPAKDTPRA